MNGLARPHWWPTTTIQRSSRVMPAAAFCLIPIRESIVGSPSRCTFSVRSRPIITLPESHPLPVQQPVPGHQTNLRQRRDPRVVWGGRVLLELLPIPYELVVSHHGRHRGCVPVNWPSMTRDHPSSRRPWTNRKPEANPLGRVPFATPRWPAPETRSQRQEMTGRPRKLSRTCCRFQVAGAGVLDASG